MKKRGIVTALMLLAVLNGTAWAAGEEQAVSCGEAELFQCGSLEGKAGAPDGIGLMGTTRSLAETIAAGIAERSASIDVSGFDLIVEKSAQGWTGPDMEALRDAYSQAINGHPELVYAGSSYAMSGYSIAGNRIRITTLKPQYDSYYTDERMAQFSQRADEALELVSEKGLTDLEKALILHDYLVEQVTYNWEMDVALKTGESMEEVEQRTGMRIYNAYGALVDGDAVCQGYALAYKLLLDRCGIDSVVVSSDTMNHAWNLVKIGGSWYHVDVTWDDPVPDLPGYCGHDNFLRSDMGIKTEEHDGWTVPDGIAVSPADEPDGLWRETTNRMYRYEGNYYYLTIRTGTGTLYRADSLNDPEPEAVQTDLSFFRHRFQDPEDGMYYSYASYGAVWQEGMLYYVSEDKDLTCYDLESGNSGVLGAVPFEAADSADQIYQSQRDTIGLYYDSRTGEIAAVSRTRPDTELARFAVKEYPVSWDQMDEDVTALAGGVRKEGALQVGLVWAGEDQSVELLAAFYQDGRLVKTKIVTSEDWTQGLNVLELDVHGYPGYDRVTLFLLSDGSVPCCPKKSA